MSGAWHAAIRQDRVVSIHSSANLFVLLDGLIGSPDSAERGHYSKSFDRVGYIGSDSSTVVSIPRRR